MARKITTQAAAALFANKTFKQSNTCVEGGALLYYYDFDAGCYA